MSKGLLIGLGALVLALVAGLVLMTGGEDPPKRTVAPVAAPTGSPTPRLPRPRTAVTPRGDEPGEAEDPAEDPAATPPDEDVDPAARPSLPALAPASLAKVRGSVFARTQRCFGPRGEGPGMGKRGRVVIRAQAVVRDGVVTLEGLTYTPDGLVAPPILDCVKRGIDGFSMPIPEEPDGEQLFVSSVQVP